MGAIEHSYEDCVKVIIGKEAGAKHINPDPDMEIYKDTDGDWILGHKDSDSAKLFFIIKYCPCCGIDLEDEN